MSEVDLKSRRGPIFSALYGNARSLFEQKPSVSTVLPDIITYEEIEPQNSNFAWGNKITFVLPQYYPVIGETDLLVSLGEIKKNGTPLAANELVSFVNDAALYMWERIEVQVGTQVLLTYYPENLKMEEILTVDQDQDRRFDYERGLIPYPAFHGRYNTNPDGSFRPYGQVESAILSKPPTTGANPLAYNTVSYAAAVAASAQTAGTDAAGKVPIAFEPPQDPNGTVAKGYLVYPSSGLVSGTTAPIGIVVTDPGSGYLRPPRVYKGSDDDPNTFDEIVDDYIHVTLNAESTHDLCKANAHWRFHQLLGRHRAIQSGPGGNGEMNLVLPLRLFWTRSPLYYLRMQAVRQEMRLIFYPRVNISDILVDRTPGSKLTGLSVDIKDVRLRLHVHEPLNEINLSSWRASWPIKEYQILEDVVVSGSVGSSTKESIKLNFTRPFSELVLVVKRNDLHTDAAPGYTSRTKDDIDADRYTNWDANLIEEVSLRLDNQYMPTLRQVNADFLRRRLTQKFYQKTPYLAVLPFSISALSPQASTPTGFIEPSLWSNVVLEVVFKKGAAWTGTLDVYAATWNVLSLDGGNWTTGTA